MSATDNRDVVFSSPWFDLVARRSSDGGPPHYVLETLDYVAVVAATQANQYLLVRQYRPALEKMSLEFPCGHVDPGETPEQAARRELLEETGFDCETMTLLAVLNPDTGRLGNKMWCFATRDARLSTAPVTREDGVEAVTCTRAELNGWVRDGTLGHTHALALLALTHLDGWSVLDTGNKLASAPQRDN